MPIHPEPSPLAGQTVQIRADVDKIGGRTIRVEDYWDRLTGRSWMVSDGNPACLLYAMRTGLSSPHVPLDDEVVYGQGALVHVSEIDASTIRT